MKSWKSLGLTLSFFAVACTGCVLRRALPALLAPALATPAPSLQGSLTSIPGDAQPTPHSADQRNLAEMVKPSVRDAQRWGDARCNDGSPFGFVIALAPSGQRREWLVYLQGGGYCDDKNYPCSERDLPLTTSPHAGDGEQAVMTSNGILLRDPALNPIFYDFNLVYAHYCSSDLWSGATSDRRSSSADADGWYFSGKLNVKAMIEVLIDHFHLDPSNPSTMVLLAGGSAGGNGVQNNADTLSQLLPRVVLDGHLKIINDGGLAVSWEGAQQSSGTALAVPTRFAHLYDFWGAQLNPLCEAALVAVGQHPGRCFQSDIVYPFITHPAPQGLGVPFMAVYCSIDRWALGNLELDPGDPADRTLIEAYRVASLSTLQAFEWAFSGGDHSYHTLLKTEEFFTYGLPGTPLVDVVNAFWAGGSPQRVIFGNP